MSLVYQGLQRMLELLAFAFAYDDPAQRLRPKLRPTQCKGAVHGTDKTLNRTAD